jgi:membrane protease subunit HflK
MTKRRRIVVAIAGAALAYLATGFFVVQPNQQAIVRRFGRAVDPPVREGLHWDLPVGFATIDRVAVDERRQVAAPPSLGSSTDPLGMAEYSGSGQYLTGDQNLIDVGLAVQYTARDDNRDLKAYMFGSIDSQRLLIAIVESLITELAAATTVDQILLSAQSSLVAPLEQRLQPLADSYGLGIQIRSVHLTRLATPMEVADAFSDVLKARSDKERRIHEALAYETQTRYEARARVQQICDDASAYETRRLAEATSQAHRFNELLSAYRLAPTPSAVWHRLFLETMEDALPRLKKVLVSNGPDSPPIDLSIMRSTKE